MSKKGDDLVPYKLVKMPEKPDRPELMFIPAMGEPTLEILGDILTENKDRFEEQSAYGATTNQDCLIVWGTVDSPGFAYYKVSALYRLLRDRGIDPKAFLRWAAENGYVQGDAGRNTVVKRIPSYGKVCRCVKFLIETEQV